MKGSLVSYPFNEGGDPEGVTPLTVSIIIRILDCVPTGDINLTGIIKGEALPFYLNGCGITYLIGPAKMT